MCLTGLNGYYNGELQEGSPMAWVDFDTWAIDIGRAASSYWAGSIQAVAIYNSVLSAAQVLAISNAMAALPFEMTVPAYPGPTAAEAGEFMLVWLTNSHVNTSVMAAEMEKMTKYLKEHAARLGIGAVIYGGDYADSPAEAADRAVFVAAMENLEDIPHLLAIGNHDYDYSGRAATIHNGVFGQSYYTAKSWWSGGFYEAGHSENAYLLLTFNSVDYIILALEFFPRQAVIEWADALLTTYAARKAIVITHAYETALGAPFAFDDYFGPTTYLDICGADYHWGNEMWDELFNLHDNVILVQSGHVAPHARHVTNSAGGQPVHQVLQNFQGDDGYEDSMMRFMRFNPTAETIEVETYSPVTLQKSTNGENQFTLTY